MKMKITNIDWDKDSDDNTNLPTSVEVEIAEVYENMADDISEWLSDKFGYCHNGFRYDFVNDNNEIKKENVEAAKRVLIDNGIEEDEADVVLQALGYALLNQELESLIWDE